MVCFFTSVLYRFAKHGCFLVHSRLPSAFLTGCPNTWLVSVYTWVEREQSVLPKNTTRCPRQWNEPDRLICLPILFSTSHMDLNLIHPVPMMKKRLFSSAIFQQECHWPVRYASEDNINFSLSLFTVGDLPNGFSFLFILYFAWKSLLLMKLPVDEVVLLGRIQIISLW